VTTLDAIAAWEIDAALEPPGRAFVETRAIEAIADGGPRLVVGPRGAGKTAASRLITTISAGDRRAARLGLKDAFIAALRPLAAPDMAARASASARYLILLTAFETLMEEQLLGGAEIRDLAQRFSVGLDPDLAAALELVFNRSILYEVFGEAGPLAPARGDVADEIAGLEEAMARVLDGRCALVLLDEAVDRSIVARALDDLRVKAFQVLLRGAADLAKGAAGGAIAPVVFTRPGVFARLPEADRLAWANKRFDLIWTPRELRDVLDYRVAVAIPRKLGASPERPAGAFERLFAQAVREVAGRGCAPLDLVWPLTRARPRDAVFFVRAAARNARHRGAETIDAEALMQAEKTYSAFLLADMTDEIRDVAPDIDVVMRALAGSGQREMSAQDFVDLIERALAAANTDEGVAGARTMIECCYESSVIGNVVGEGRNAQGVYAHSAPGAALDYNRPVIVHPGLTSALDLTYAAAAA
jgi:hypothetical protein